MCASYTKPASLRCSGCIEGIDANGLPASPTQYCGKKCQIKHWKASHKKECKMMNDRKHLYRAGEFVQVHFYKLRECAFDVFFDKVEYKDHGKVHVYEAVREELRWEMLTKFK